jgi:hypothetical protein
MYDIISNKTQLFVFGHFSSKFTLDLLGIQSVEILKITDFVYKYLSEYVVVRCSVELTIKKEISASSSECRQLLF